MRLRTQVGFVLIIEQKHRSAFILRWNRQVQQSAEAPFRFPWSVSMHRFMCVGVSFGRNKKINKQKYHSEDKRGRPLFVLLSEVLQEEPEITERF